MVFATGGSARGDVESLMLLRPFSAMALVYGLYHLNREDLARYRIPFMLIGAAFALVALQLIPLPPEIWRGLPGRDTVAAVDQAIGLSNEWRPFTMTPQASWNAFWAMLPPLATLVLAAQLDLTRLRQLTPLLLALGVISAVWGLLQVLGGSESPFYTYAVTNSGSAVGAFANRNHQAALLATLPPILLVWAVLRQSARRRSSHAPRFYAVLALAAGGFIVPMTFVTGSRSGAALIALSIALLPAMTLGLKAARPQSDRSGGSARRTNRLIWLLPAIAALLVAVTVWFGRALSIDRFLAADEADARLKILPDVMAMVNAYAPWGAGAGSFEQIFAAHEPMRHLNPAYWNHAHNDWLETVLTGGAPAALLLGIAVITVGARAFRAFFAPQPDFALTLLNRLGAMIVLLLAIASITDYPLRVPFLACLFVVALTWCFARHPSHRTHADHEKDLTDE